MRSMRSGDRPRAQRRGTGPDLFGMMSAVARQLPRAYRQIGN